MTSLSFAVGVAGDLARDATAAEEDGVVLRLPPPLPLDTPRARPLPPLMHAVAPAQVIVAAPDYVELEPTEGWVELAPLPDQLLAGHEWLHSGPETSLAGSARASDDLG